MQARDPLRWSHQADTLRQTEHGKEFLAVFEFWLGAAEKLREEDPDFPAYDSLQKALVITVEQFGPILTETMADMLMLAVNFWEHGAALAEGFTPVETSVVHEAVFRATERLQEQASADA